MAEPVTTFPLAGPIDLMVRLDRGSVRVVARDDLTEAVVRLEAPEGSADVLDRVVVELRGRALVVHGPREASRFGFRKSDHDLIDVTVEVPTRTAIQVRTEHARIEVTGRCGSADVATGGAVVALEHVAGDLRLRCGSGESRIGTVTGSAQVRSDSGSTQISEVGGALDCRSGSGDLAVDVLRGALHVRTGSGSATIGALHGNVDFASGSGPITLGVPAGVSAQVDVTTGSGVLHSDIPVEQAPAPGARAIRVRARTGSGAIHLLRAG